MFHSAISPLLNIGLLTPNDIIGDCLELTDDVPLNALEGFLRQVIGWREFIRGIYSHYDDEQKTSNFLTINGNLASTGGMALQGIRPWMMRLK